VVPDESQEGGLADAKLTSGDSAGETSPHDLVESDGVDAEPRAPNVLALVSGSSETSLDAFDEEAPFELGDSGDDREHCLSEGRSRVDLLTQGDELNVEVPEQLKGIHQVAY
jgi:hypothetical protein